MYVALRPFKNQLPTGGTQQLYPGDEVAGFLSWPLINQTAAINAQLVRQADEQQRHHIESLIATTADETGSQRRQQTNAVVAAAGVAQHSPVAQQVADEVAKGPVADPTPADDAPGAVVCEQCEFVARTPHAMKIHVGKAHKVIA